MIRNIQADEAARNKLNGIIKDRPIFLFAQGPTVKKFAEYKNFFEDKDICYVCLNKLELTEEVIPNHGYDILFRSDTRNYLSSINETISFIEREHETAWIIKYVDQNSNEYRQRHHLWGHDPVDVDEQINIHRLQDRTVEQKNNIRKFCENISYYRSHEKIYGDSSIFHNNSKCSCSISAALNLLLYLKTNDIYIFGFDGGSIEGKDYFEKEAHTDVGLAGYISGIESDTKLFNENFWSLIGNKDNYSRVFNVSPESHVNNLKKISHEDLIFHWRN